MCSEYGPISRSFRRTMPGRRLINNERESSNDRIDEPKKNISRVQRARNTVVFFLHISRGTIIFAPVTFFHSSIRFIKRRPIRRPKRSFYSLYRTLWTFSNRERLRKRARIGPVKMFYFERNYRGTPIDSRTISIQRHYYSTME